LLLPLGFKRTKPAFWTRPHDHVIEFIHLHLFTFGPKFRAHLGIRVLNDTFEAEALNGPDSDGAAYKLEFDAADLAVDECSSEVVRYCREVGEPWFARWRDHRALVLDKQSPLRQHGKAELRAALDGAASPENIARSRKLFGVA
jgi:hypothetical protein